MRLPDLQGAIAGVLRGGAPPPSLLAAIRADRPDVAAARLAIHARHVQASLSAALETSFPLTRRLVGDGFFAYAAATFISAHPPAGPIIAQYGDGFPDFLGAFAPARSLPWLAEAAAAEWRMQESGRKHAGLPLSLPALAAARIGESSRLALDPSLRYQVSAWPVATILRAVLADTPPAEALSPHAEHLEIRREPAGAGGRVSFRVLPPAVFAFRQALAGGAALAGAFAAAAAVSPEFDVTAALRDLAAERLIVGVDTAPQDQRND